MNKQEAQEYLKTIDPKMNPYPVLEVDGKNYKFMKDTHGEWMGAESEKNDNINIVLDRTQLEKDLQDKYEAEHDNAMKLRTITEQLLNEKVKRGELKQSDIPAFLQGQSNKNAGADSKKGGGVVGLGEHSKSPQDMVYENMSEGISDLYARVRKGDKEAKKKLDELKALAVDDIKVRSAKNESFYLVRCVNCGAMCDVNKISGSRCPQCDAKLGVGG